ncbi:hypothetical protein [Nocardioides sp.]|uniref:hypothetical protein n=1 Tax=Nocardioides sp. TaxID=35761 RepID=UPI00356920D0
MGVGEEESERDSPSLELPSLGFGRKRRQKGTDEATEQSGDSPEEGVDAPAEAAGDATETAAPTPVTAEPEASVAETPAPEPEEAEPTQPVAAAPRPRWDTPATRPQPPAPAPVFADEVPDAGAEESATEAAHHDEDEAENEAEDASASTAGVAALRAVSGMTGAILTGLLIGAATVGLTWGSLSLCEVIQGTSSCGNPGYLLLLAILAAMTMLGSQLLRLFGIPDAPSTSFLAVGLLAVLALLLLVDVLLSWWMIIIIPLFSMATFALAHWVTTTFTEEDA